MDHFLIGLLILNVILWLALLFVSWRKSKTTYSGTIVVTKKTEGVKSYSLEVESIDDLETKREVIFRVERSEDT